MKYVLKDVANVIRSKNAGPYELTLDIILKDREVFDKIKEKVVTFGDNLVVIPKIGYLSLWLRGL